MDILAHIVADRGGRRCPRDVHENERVGKASQVAETFIRFRVSITMRDARAYMKDPMNMNSMTSIGKASQDSGVPVNEHPRPSTHTDRGTPTHTGCH